MSLTEQQVIDTLDGTGVYGAITVGTTPTEAKVSTERLYGRSYLMIQPKTANVFFGFDSSVTTLTGVEIYKDQTFLLPIGDGILVWLVSGGAGNNVRVQELR